MYPEQEVEQSLFGSTIQFWLLSLGFVEDHKSKIDYQAIDRAVGSKTDKRLDRPTIQKPNGQIDRPRSPQPGQRLNRPINRQLDHGN